MKVYHVFILSIVEGITEFLPISSTGHLILAGHLLEIPQTEFLKSFNIIIQLGAILAVVVLYWQRLLQNQEVFKRIAAAFLPTAIIGLLAYNWVKIFLLNNEQVVIWALLLGGIFLILFELKYQEDANAIGDIAKLSFKKAFVIGIFQSLAIIPGVSRSAATIIGGLFLNLKRYTIVEFSFLLAVPTMAAATALDIFKNAHTFTQDQFGLLALGFLISFFVAIVSIKFLLCFIKNHNFIIFGLYRIVLALGAFLL